MPKFESFAPVESQKNEVETSLENRKGVIEKLTSKFPRLRPLVLAFITSTAALTAPELAGSYEPAQEAKIEHKATRETAEAALEKISDQAFKDAVKKIEDEMASIGSNMPTNSIYSEVWKSVEVNHGATVNEKKNGSLPESAQNIFISSEHASGMLSKDGRENGKSIANMMDGTKSAFYISPTEKGTIVEGGKVQIEGIGLSRTEALQNALEHSVMFLGEEVTTNTELNERMEDSDNPSSKTILTETIKTGGKHFVKEYKIKKVEQGKGTIMVTGGDGKEYHVTVEITGGQFTPEK